MTVEQLISLQEAIRKALAATNNAPTPIVRRYIRVHFPQVIEANSLTIEDMGLDELIRNERKNGVDPAKPASNGNIRNFCLDFGLDHSLPLDEQISIPEDPDDVMYGACNWVESEDASVDDADLHIILLDAQTASTSEKARNWRTLRQYAAEVVSFRTDIPFRILSAFARRQTKLKRKLTPKEVQFYLDRIQKEEDRRKANLSAEDIKAGLWKLGMDEMDRIL